MIEENWKTIAIVLLILFIAENLLFAWGYYMVVEEERKMNECYYNVCSEYPEAWIDGNICYCYDYDVIGDFVLAKTEVIK